MRGLTAFIIVTIAMTTVLFTNCGKSPSTGSSSVLNSADGTTTGGNTTGGSTTGGTTTGGTTGGTTTGGSTTGVIAADDYVGNLSKLTAAKNDALVDLYIPQVRKDGKDNRYSASLFSIAREMIQYSSPTVSYQKLYVATPYLKTGTLLVHFYKSKKAKAPLAILLNPLYSGDFANQMSRFMEYFAKRDFHVLVFMNPWSPDVITKGPTFFPGDVWVEGQMHLDLIDKLINEKIGKSAVSGATLVGLSYGAFLSTVVKAYDQRRANPVITGPTLVLNPPNDMVASMTNIDRQSLEITAAEGNACILSGGFASFLVQAVQYDDYNKTTLDEKCAKYMDVNLGFKFTMIDAITSLNASKKLGLTTTQINSMTYKTYMTNVAKIAPKPGQTNIGFWINDAQKNGYSKFLVLSGYDDNINEGNDLNLNPYFAFDESSLLVVPTGGHTGFREAKSRDKTCGKDWATCFLNAVYY